MSLSKIISKVFWGALAVGCIWLLIVSFTDRDAIPRWLKSGSESLQYQADKGADLRYHEYKESCPLMDDFVETYRTNSTPLGPDTFAGFKDGVVAILALYDAEPNERFYLALSACGYNENNWPTPSTYGREHYLEGLHLEARSIYAECPTRDKAPGAWETGISVETATMNELQFFYDNVYNPRGATARAAAYKEAQFQGTPWEIDLEALDEAISKYEEGVPKLNNLCFGTPLPTATPRPTNTPGPSPTPYPPGYIFPSIYYPATNRFNSGRYISKPGVYSPNWEHNPGAQDCRLAILTDGLRVKKWHDYGEGATISPVLLEKDQLVATTCGFELVAETQERFDLSED